VAGLIVKVLRPMGMQIPPDPEVDIPWADAGDLSHLADGSPASDQEHGLQTAIDPSFRGTFQRLGQATTVVLGEAELCPFTGVVPPLQSMYNRPP
jgi:hypothetical protein